MNISQNGINLIKGFEGLRLQPYLDSVGVPTIGYGSTYCICGSKITMQSKPITEAVAEFMLRTNVQIYVDAVNKAITKIPTQNQFDAMVSLCYNIGVGNFSKSTLVKKFNQGDIQGTADQFPRWNLAGGKVLQGLVNRRAKERVLFLS